MPLYKTGLQIQTVLIILLLSYSLMLCFVLHLQFEAYMLFGEFVSINHN